MFVTIEHEIHDAARFQPCAEQVFPLPEGLQVHLFLPATDLSRAVGLYEAPSLERLRDHLDPTLGDASTQRYFPVAEERAIGLPAYDPGPSTELAAG
ncbi:hypothetical protein TVNIR_3054 [Thioalkalivibrio nitratireducens DSM 14787]|uniref:Uncharacterized protein n=1 Tax=Thioalkalivibrio nitratireducens (strain DSM 14787 / UNIQEM 213 / ALEN2) TaxID=1255043 RepID=L0E217_THIND|nr:hypothetical protein [Thioalkalivibrio nitratireducens]AGA34691.1 hypothetical protein TVNIR_3054 [Thioalkalivibrio nitratireducens DSM 14787]